MPVSIIHKPISSQSERGDHHYTIMSSPELDTALDQLNGPSGPNPSQDRIRGSSPEPQGQMCEGGGHIE